MGFDTLITEKKGKTALISINRPKSLNALNKKVFDELSQVLKLLEKDDTVRSIILTGSGRKAFVAGADIKEFSSFNGQQGEMLAKENQKNVFDEIENFPKPIIAAINGFALGGGLELALACHIRIASENAKMGFPEVSLGLIPGYGGTQRLPQIVGKGRANELIFSAKMIDCDKALAIGLINRKASAENLLPKAIAMAEEINQNSSNALEKAIESINQYATKKGYKTEIENFGKCFDHNDFKEGVSAFLNKRKPVF